MAYKASKIYFITAYMEFLLKEGLKCEEVYVGDASRFLRFLLAQASSEALLEFVNQSSKTEASRRRVISSLNRFLTFINSNLEITNPNLTFVAKDQEV